MDKMLAIIIIFLGITFSLAGLLVMGAVPELFKQGDQLDQALIQQHEDEARENQTKHEDQARDIQYQMENAARDKQRDQIVKETNKSINNLEQRLVKFINESSNRSVAGAVERQLILDNILNVSKRTDVVVKDHDIIQNQVANQTKQTYNLLDKVAERNYEGTLKNKELLTNLTKEVEEIKKIHKQLLSKLHN
jgi:hypothetical protein